MIINHGLVVDPASGLSEHMDILVKNGKIARIAPEISEDSEEILEAGGLVVGPGLIETHVQLRETRLTNKNKNKKKRRFYYCNLYGEYIPYGRQYRHPKR